METVKRNASELTQIVLTGNSIAIGQNKLKKNFVSDDIRISENPLVYRSSPDMIIQIIADII